MTHSSGESHSRISGNVVIPSASAESEAYAGALWMSAQIGTPTKFFPATTADVYPESSRSIAKNRVSALMSSGFFQGTSYFWKKRVPRFSAS